MVECEYITFKVLVQFQQADCLSIGINTYTSSIKPCKVEYTRITFEIHLKKCVITYIVLGNEN